MMWCVGVGVCEWGGANYKLGTALNTDDVVLPTHTTHYTHTGVVSMWEEEGGEVGETMLKLQINMVKTD